MLDKIMKEVLSPGNNIYNIRKKLLRCTQSDLACDNLTREMISQIENSKKPLTWSAAHSLADNINIYAKIKNIIYSVTAAELMRTEIEQANDIIKYCLNHVNILIKTENSTEQFLKIYTRADNIILKYNIDRKLVFNFYMLCIDYCLENSLLIKAKQYIFSCCNIIQSSEQRLSVFVKLTKILHYISEYPTCANNNSKFDDIIYISSFAINFYNENNFNDISILQDLYYNLALAYKDKGNYNKCFEIISIVDSLKINFLKLDILHANCLYDTARYDEAKNHYNSILNNVSFTNDNTFIFRTHQNLALLHLKIGEIDKAIDYIKLAKDIKCHRSDAEIAYLYYFAFEIDLASDCGSLKIKHSFTQAIEKCNVISNDTLKINLFSKAIDYFIKCKNNESILENINAMEKDILNKQLLSEKYFHVFNKAAEYFLTSNQPNNANIIFLKEINLSSIYRKSNLF